MAVGAASFTHARAPGCGGGQDKVLLPFLQQDNGLRASQNDALGHGFVGACTSGGRVGPSSPRTSWRRGAGCFCHEQARQSWLGERLPAPLSVNNVG